MLRSIDLFSGIGGLSWALRGLATPLMFCECDAYATNVLRQNPRLPRVPICNDIRGLDAKWLSAHRVTGVDLIVAGFPCTGISAAGHRDGFKNAESHLFFELMRVVDLTHPALVFMENSPHIVNLGRAGLGVVLKQFQRRGYEVRYAQLAASDVGAPHQRRRWYCVALRPQMVGSVLPGMRSARFKPFDWGPNTEPPRTTPQRAQTWEQRVHCLGMAVVPDAARAAFIHLLTWCQNEDVLWATRAITVAASPVGSKKKQRTLDHLPPCGVMFPTGQLQAQPRVRINQRSRDFKLVFDPALFRSPKPPSVLLTSGLVDRRVRRTHWGTPTATHMEVANFLTERNKKVLSTQVRFERGTVNRGDVLSPAFVEWVMGFPRGWADTERSR